jgi:flagellar hook-basal body complex protein FliE
MNIEGIGQSVSSPFFPSTESKVADGGFDKLMNFVEKMNDNQVGANSLMSDVILGKSDDTHGAMIALEKAGIQMQLATKVRDELIQGYNKLINIQI